MKELIKITMIVTLVTGLLLLMGCGKTQDSLIPGSYSGDYHTTSGFSVDSQTYTAEDALGRWEITARMSPDAFETSSLALPFTPMQIQLRDKLCGGVVYSFTRNDVRPEIGSVVKTRFHADNDSRIKLDTGIYFKEYFPGRRKKIEGNLRLEMPYEMNCQNFQDAFGRIGGGQGSLSGFPAFIYIQI
ncbi:MAG: hypothetical protein HYW47_00690 [Deltaproteobacteria bacterium]|nr:hypothetical protein [Deltaproteobacteria bacterium]